MHKQAFSHRYHLFVKILVSPFFNTEIEKEKLCSSEDVEGGGAGAASTGGGSSGGGVSASLTPAIWEKTIPYDGETFHLEYMDLDEFLLENGIPVTLEEEELQKSFPSGKGKSIPKVTTTTTTTAPAAAAAASVSASASSPPVSATSVVNSDPEETLTVTTLQPAKLEEEEEEVEEEEEEGQEDESLSEEAAAEVELKEKRTGEKCRFVGADICFVFKISHYYIRKSFP